jgi:hypothetical protein
MLPSKLRMLIPTAGPFFTRLPLEAAFKYQDRKRYISSRRFVAPSFNDVRQILNSAQSMAVTNGSLQLATFDGDVTLYDDGFNLEPSSPVIPRLLGKLVHKKSELQTNVYQISYGRTARLVLSRLLVTLLPTATMSAFMDCLTQLRIQRIWILFRSKTSSSWEVKQTTCLSTHLLRPTSSLLSRALSG